VKLAVCAIAALLTVAVAGKLLKSTVAPGIASLTPEVRLAQAKGAIASALDEAKSVKDDPGRAEALGSIAAAQAGAGDVTASRQTLTQARQTAQSIRYGPYKDIVLQFIAIQQVKAGDLRGGLEAAHGITEDFLKVRALKFIGAAQAKAGDATASRQTFAQAIQAAQSINEMEYQFEQDRALESIAGAQAEAGDLSGGYHTANSISDDSMEAQALALVGAAQARAGHAADSRETFGQALQAAQSIKRDDYSKADAWASIAAAQAIAGDAPASGRAFTQAVQTAQSIQELPWKTLALCHIGAVQAKAGDMTASRQTFTEVRQNARNIHIAQPGGDLLESIAVAQAKAGDVSDALQIAQGIPDGTLAKARILDSVIAAQTAAGDIAGAEKTVRTLSLGGARCAGYIEIAEALLKGPQASDDEEP
jgi:hypothetical protein